MSVPLQECQYSVLLFGNLVCESLSKQWLLLKTETWGIKVIFYSRITWMIQRSPYYFEIRIKSCMFLENQYL